MPIVIRRNSPSGWDQAGQGLQNAAQTWLQGNTALAQQQNAFNNQMLQYALGERRLADANAREDRRLREMALRDDKRMAWEKERHTEDMALRREQLARALGNANMPKLATVQGPYGPQQVLFYPSTGKTAPLQLPDEQSGRVPNQELQSALEGVLGSNGPALPDFGNSSVPQTAAQDAGMGMGLSPQQPAAPSAQLSKVDFEEALSKYKQQLQEREDNNQRWALNALKQSGYAVKPEWEQRWGTPPQDAQPQPGMPQGDVQTEAPAGPQVGAQQGAATLQPGDVVDAFGNHVDVPAGIPWSDPKEVVLGDGKYSVQINSPAGLFKILGAPAPSAAERKDAAETEKLQRSQDKERQLFKSNYQTATLAFDAAEKSLEGEFESAPLRVATSFFPGTTAYDLGENLETLKALFSLDRLAELKKASPNGASGMGALSDTEGRRLAAVYGSLSIGQSRDQLRRNLKNARSIYNEMLRSWGYEVPAGNQGERTRLKYNPQTGGLE